MQTTQKLNQGVSHEICVTFNKILAISQRSVLLIDEAIVPGGEHLSTTSHLETQKAELRKMHININVPHGFIVMKKECHCL